MNNTTLLHILLYNTPRQMQALATYSILTTHTYTHTHAHIIIIIIAIRARANIERDETIRIIYA